MITGPELDLLQEVLAEDPTADVYLDVAQALLDQGETRKAATVLRRALEYGVQDLETARMLARAAGEVGDDRGLRVAAQALGEEVMRSEPVLARAYAIALDRAGDLDRAGELAEALLRENGPDDVLQGIIERMHAPPPENSIRARDPFFTVGRAESYFENGRPDLAVRAYRRILAVHPDNQAIHARLLRLRSMPREARPWVDDLSEEYWVGRPMTAIPMPLPTLVPVPSLADEEVTVPGPPERAFGPGDAGPGDFDDEEVTTVMSTAKLKEAARMAAPRVDAVFDDSFEDEEATTIMSQSDIPGFRKQVSTTLTPEDDDADEEATVNLDDKERRTLAQRMPGVDDLRRALAEDDDLDDEDDADEGEQQDADSIIEQARAIEQRAADRRRRSLLRK